MTNNVGFGGLFDGSDFIRKLRIAGGYTGNPVTGEIPLVGWAVSDAGKEVCILDCQLEYAVLAYLRDNYHAWESGAYFGAWLDNRSDAWFLDITRVYHDATEAVLAGMANDQRAIYNLDTGETIRF